MKPAPLALLLVAAIALGGCLTRRVDAPPSRAILDARAAAKARAAEDRCNQASFATSAPVPVAFAYNSPDFDPSSRDLVARAAQWLACRPAILVTITATHDAQGTPEAQRRLVDERAAAVRQTLLQAGLPAARIVAAPPAGAQVLALNARGRGW